MNVNGGQIYGPVGFYYAGYFPPQDLSDKEIEDTYGRGEFMDMPVGYNGVLPNGQGNFYAQCLRYIASYYNRPSDLYLTQRSQGISDSLAGYLTNGPVAEIIKNFLYFHGDQPNDSFAYLTQDPITNVIGGSALFSGAGEALIPTPWMKGNKIYELLTHLFGTFSDRVGSAQLSVTNESPGAIAEQEKQLIKAFMLKELKRTGLFEQLENVGMKVNPFPAFEEADFDELEDYLRERPQEVEAMRLMRSVEFYCDTKRLVLQALMFCLIGRYAGLDIDLEGAEGRISQKVIPPYKLITDNNADDDFGSNHRFRGYVEYLTPEEILMKYPEMHQFRDELFAMRNETLDQPNNFYGNDGRWYFNWILRQGDGRIAVVKAYWKSYPRSKFTYEYGEDGTPKKVKIDNSGEEGVRFEMLRTGILIGNRWVIRCGIKPYQVRNIMDKRKVEFPIQYVAPYTMIGYNRSLVDRLKYRQDELDALRNKINDAISHDLGNAYVFYSDAIDDDPYRVISDIKKNRLTFLRMVDGEELDGMDRKRLMEKLDLSISQNVFRYIELQREYKTEMEEIASTSKIALGQQTGYVGMNTQMNTIAQNTRGVEYYFDALMQLYANAQQYSIELLKLSFMGKGKKFVERILDNRGLQYLKMSESFSFSDLRVKVQVQDIINEQAKQSLITAANLGLQQGQIGMGEYAEIITAKTFSELKRKIDTMERKKARQAMEQQMMMAQQAQMAQQQAIAAQSQGNLENTALREEAATERKAMDMEAKGVEMGMQAAQMAQQDATAVQ